MRPSDRQHSGLPNINHEPLLAGAAWGLWALDQLLFGQNNITNQPGASVYPPTS